MRLKTNNPYSEVIDIIMASEGFYWTDYIVLLRIAGDLDNVFLECDCINGFSWQTDWADVPVSEIELLGFCPLDKVIIPSEYLVKDYIIERGLESMARKSDGLGNDRNFKEFGKIVKDSTMDDLAARKEQITKEFLYAHGWDGKDMDQARKITEGYSFLVHPDHTFEIMRSEEAERLYGKPLELEEI